MSFGNTGGMSNRDAIDVVGPDATKYLQTQLSQDVARMADGERAWAFLLQPNGKVDSLVEASRLDAEHWTVEVDGGYGEQVLARLQRFLIRTKATLTLRANAGSPEAGDAVRIEDVWPKMGAEIVPGVTIPAETGVVDRAVSFTKGCYPGQELVERMDARQVTARRTLRAIDVAPGTEAGAEVDVDGHAAVVTTVAGGRALAYVGRG